MNLPAMYDDRHINKTVIFSFLFLFGQQERFLFQCFSHSKKKKKLLAQPKLHNLRAKLKVSKGNVIFSFFYFFLKEKCSMLIFNLKKE